MRVGGATENKHSPIREYKQPRIIGLYEALTIESQPLNRFEKTMIALMSRFTMREMTGGGFRLADNRLRSILNNIIYQNDGTRKEFTTAVRDTVMLSPDANKTINPLLELATEVKEGNFLLRTLEGKGNCLDSSLTAMLIAKCYYPSIIVELVPYNLASIARKTLTATPLMHDSFGVVYQENGQKFAMANGGLVASFADIKAPTKFDQSVRAILRETKETAAVREAKAHLEAIYNHYNKSAKHAPTESSLVRLRPTRFD